MIKLHSTILEDEYTSYIKEHYDFDAQKANEVNVPSFHLPNGDWNIIAIIGASGSGKSTILNELSSQYGGGEKAVIRFSSHHLKPRTSPEGSLRATFRHRPRLRSVLVQTAP